MAVIASCSSNAETSDGIVEDSDEISETAETIHLTTLPTTTTEEPKIDSDFANTSDMVFETSEKLYEEWSDEDELCRSKPSSEQNRCLWENNIDLCQRSESLITDNHEFINDTEMLNFGSEFATGLPEAEDTPENFYSWTAARGMATMVRQTTCYWACRIWDDFSQPQWAGLDLLDREYCDFIYDMPGISSDEDRENCTDFAGYLRTLYDDISSEVSETYNWNTEIKSGGRCQITFHITLSACLNSSVQCLDTHSECRAFEQSANSQTDTRISFTAEPSGNYTCFVKIYATLETS